MIRFTVVKLFCIWLFCLDFGQVPGQSQVTFTLEEIAGRKVLVVSPGRESTAALSNGEQVEWAQRLRVYVGEHEHEPAGKMPPRAGNYEYQSGRILFRPFVPFRPGLTYTAFFREKDFHHFTIPKAPDSPEPELTAIYPTADTLPANQLKFYLHFSTPMAEGHAYRDLLLVDDRGDTLSAPFVRLEPELWNLDHTRLTLWMDPGRVKRALGPNEAEGAPLEIGRQYTLHVLPGWKNRQGRPLKEDYQKSFCVKAADRKKPSVGQWQTNKIPAGSRDPLELHFGEAMDQALAEKTLSVWYGEDTEVTGAMKLAAQERTWQFVPKDPWKAGQYRIRIDALLEDLAGNNLNRLFDRDLFAEANPSPDQKYHFLEFSVP